MIVRRLTEQRSIHRETGAHPEARKAMRVFARSGLRVVAALTTGSSSMLALALKPSQENSALFGTRREVLCFIDLKPRLSEDALDTIRTIVEHELPVVTAELILVLSSDKSARSICAEYSELTKSMVIGFSHAEVGRCVPYGSQPFIRLLQRRFFNRDLYAYASPVRESFAFFGRQGMIIEQSAKLKRAANSVGIFGLRRMGKTSLLYRIHERLKQNGSAYIAHIDLERIDAIEASAQYFFWSLGEAIFDAHKAIRDIDGFRLFGKSKTIVDVHRSTILELFRHDLELLLRESKRPLVVSLDELEMMFPGPATNPGWDDCFVQIWKLLRGMSQEHERKLVFLVAGTNPLPIESPQVGTRQEDNPIFQWIEINYLPPLRRAETKELLTQTGARMGLLWADDATDAVFEAVGGHPHLTRAFGSQAHRQLLPRDTDVAVTKDFVKEAYEEFIRHRSLMIGQLLAVLQDHYPDEHYMLETLAMGRLGEFQNMAALAPEFVSHLRGYGLVDLASTPPTMRIEVLQTFMQLRAQDNINQPERSLSKGDSVGRGAFEILNQIGTPGGYSEVYRARVLIEQEQLAVGSEVAIKVLKTGSSFQQLQREVEALQTIDHDHVVRLIDYGSEANQQHYIVMEYLEGSTLKARCVRSNRLNAEETQLLLVSMLRAMEAFHPDRRGIDRGRSGEFQTSIELESTTQARHGYIHRDIKPENIVWVDGRGPILIDFNISSKAGDRSKTTSSTPGYLRPLVAGERWAPRHDLFSLGVTVSQAVAGQTIGAAADPEEQMESIQNLLLVVEADASASHFEIIRRLCSVDPEVAYETAYQALSSMQASTR